MKKQEKNLNGAAAFESASFQRNFWQPFLEMINTEYQELGERWQEQTVQKFKNDLTADYE